MRLSEPYKTISVKITKTEKTEKTARCLRWREPLSCDRIALCQLCITVLLRLIAQLVRALP